MSARQRFPDRGAVVQPPHPYLAPTIMFFILPMVIILVIGDAEADDDGGAIRQLPARHCSYLARRNVQRRTGGGAIVQPPHPRYRAIVTAADHDRNAIHGQLPSRHCSHRADVAVCRFPDRGAIVQPPHPYRAVVTAADDNRGAVGWPARSLPPRSCRGADRLCLPDR